MDLGHLRTFVAVAQQGTRSEASLRRAGRTSQQIA